jgi:hypothetical protein
MLRIMTIFWGKPDIIAPDLEIALALCQEILARDLNQETFS